MGLVKAVLHEFGLDGGISLFLASEVPPGTGLGSSSTVAVALIKALSTLAGLSLSSAQIAERACTVELEKLRSPIGKQDQYAAAYGGMNAITFTSEGVTGEPVAISGADRDLLQRRIMLFFTGGTRSANAILRQQSSNSSNDKGDAVAALHAIKAAAYDVRACLERGDLDAFGAILAETWEQKKKLAAGVSNPHVDEMYDLARKHGVIGGKLAGAGGGGFLLLYCHEEHQAAVTDALEEAGLHRMEFGFDVGGPQILMNAFPRTAWRWAAQRAQEAVSA
jgi:D-glycero-alpha-D-manno-heptose-7-phosphate kinase